MIDRVEPREYDDYPIPAYDNTLSEVERKRLAEEAAEKLRAFIREHTKK